MKKQLANKIAHELVYKTYKCPYCGRLVPNFSLLTKDMCIWCDYRSCQEKRQKLDLLNQIWYTYDNDKETKDETKS